MGRLIQAVVLIAIVFAGYEMDRMVKVKEAMVPRSEPNPGTLGPPGRMGGIEAGIWGTYSSVWTGYGYRYVFVPDKKQPVQITKELP